MTDHRTSGHGRTLVSRLAGGLVLLALAGCQAEDPQNYRFDAGPASDVLLAEPDLLAGCAQAQKLGAPVVEQPSAKTAQLRQPLRGRALGAATLVAIGATGSATPVSVGDEGGFCIEVDLLPDAPNSITLTPYDAAGCPGISATVSLTHASGPTRPENPGTGLTIKNLVRGAKIDASQPATTGSVTVLGDGDSKSWAKFELWDPEVSRSCNKFVWVRVDLGKLYTVSKAKIRWGPSAVTDKLYATCYALLLSAKASPVDPDPKHQDWIVAHHESNATGQDQSITFSPESARWAALLLYEDDASDWLQYEKFVVGEFEVFGQDPNVVPPPPADTCDN